MAKMASTLLLVVLAVLLHSSSAAGNKPSFRQHRRLLKTYSASGRQGPPPFECVKSGFFGDSKDCARFYRCVDFFGEEQQFTLFEFICGEATIFDEALSVCNHPAWVNPRPACWATTPWLDTVTTGGNETAPVTSAPAGTSSEASVISSTESTTAAATAAPTAGLTSPAPSVESTTSGQETTVPSEAVVPGSSTTMVEEIQTTPTSAPIVPPTESSSPAAPLEASTTVAPETSSATSAPEVAPETSSATSAPETSSATSAPEVEVASTTTVPEVIAESSSAAPVQEVSSTAVPSTASPEIAIETTSASAQPEPTTAAAAVTSAPTEAGTASPIVSPPTMEAPFRLTCNDDKFHRHPLRCDLYYKCVWTDLSFSVDLRACPPGLLYDEASATCRIPGRTTPCVFATFPVSVTTETPTTTTEPSTTTVTTTTEPTTTTTVSTTTVESSSPSIQYTLAAGSLYDCKKPGHYPYQLDCVRFYRCFEVEPTVLKGLLYRCPEGYAYSTETERCEKQETLPVCNRTGIRLPMNFPVPLIPLQDTTVVLLEDFDKFFSNPNYFYTPRRKFKLRRY
ncbi:hypothetical protein GHT06_011153 [Daphnia sinensis]|uniref:Chitin-binding type-2 domain-containing protein n=1 Tax=Daphnia sinensis TaxID=1820382 RepID=A0AAD5KZH4_9CRUS|nr:hypothetical protein GHT06_011153 [Daphnia sinensis]